MAEEIPEERVAPVTLAPVVETKAKRAPRRSKEEIAAANAAKAKSKVERKFKAAPPAAVTAKEKTTNQSTQKVAAQPASTKRAKNAMVAPVSPSDDFADLLELEAENQKLRKSLSEKLRAENADLRKKLGLA